LLEVKVIPKYPPYGVYTIVTNKPKKNDTADNLLLKDRKKRKNEQPTHKTAHLQIAQADTRLKFAKELFSCRRTSGN